MILEQLVKGDTGSNGSKGDQGNQGIQGNQGVQGDKGSTGNTGAVGPNFPVFFNGEFTIASMTVDEKAGTCTVQLEKGGEFRLALAR